MRDFDYEETLQIAPEGMFTKINDIIYELNARVAAVPSLLIVIVADPPAFGVLPAVTDIPPIVSGVVVQPSTFCTSVTVAV